MDLDPLPREFYDRPVVDVARSLVGKRLVRRTPEGTAVGRIVEVEAYLHEGDPACHAYRGRTRKNATMFGRPGLAYVFPIHARHCLNAVAEAPGRPAAVLIRAVAPESGIELMRRRRGAERLLELARGPARLCEALAIDRRLDGWDLTLGRRLWLADGGGTAPPPKIAVSPRIGVTSGQDMLLRFYVPGDPFVSGPRGPRE